MMLLGATDPSGFSVRCIPCLGALFFAVAGAAHARDADWSVADTRQPHREVSFELSEGTWMSVDVSPDGQRIVFDLLGDIYIMPAKGAEATAIHDGPAMQRMPRFSPDGGRIAFLSDQGGADNVWISDLEGGNQRAVTRETTRGLLGPAWAPDGGVIAAARMFDGADKLHSSQIVAFDVMTAEEEVLANIPASGENVHDANYAPDGRSVFFTEKVTPPHESPVYIDANHANYAVNRLDIETGEVEQLIGGFGGAFSPSPSPDGRLLAFVRRVQEKTLLFVYDIENRVQRAVFDGLDRDGSADYLGQGMHYPQYGWFPDSRTILIWYAGRLHRIDTQTGASEDVPFKATSHHRISEPARFRIDLAPETFRVRSLRNLAVSPNGEQFAFIALGHLWTVDRAGHAIRRTGGSRPVSGPAFSPDGRVVAYVKWDDSEGGSLHALSLEDESVQTLARSKGIIAQPRFSPDGAELVYKISEGDNCLGGYRARPGLYIIPANGGEATLLYEEGNAPRFSPDGERIYFTTEQYSGEGMSTVLQSVGRDGRDARVHLKTHGADTRELLVSPELRWLAFKHDQKYYLRQFNADAPESLLEVDGARLIGPDGGYSLTWGRRFSKIYWLYGPTIVEYGFGDDGSASAAPLVETRIVAPADRPQRTIALVNGRIITMDGDRVIERGTILVTGNKIAAVGEIRDVDIPEDAAVYDVSGKTVMPGLIDMHGHLDLCYYSSSGLVPKKHPLRYAALAYGVTTNYDPYTSELLSYMMDEMTATGEMVGPRPINVGAVAYGRIGKSDGVFVPIESYADAQTFMRRKNALGGHVVKSYRQPMRRQRQQLIRAGREHGVMVDVEGESNFYFNLTMILDGHFNLQHNIPLATIYDDVIQLFASSGVAYTPTLTNLFGELLGENYIYQHSRFWEEPKAKTFLQTTTSGYSPLGMAHYAPPYARGMTTIQSADELWDASLRSVSRTIRDIDKAGGTVNAGSHGQAAGIALHWEMELLAEGGMSPGRILRAATINGARTLKVDDQIGSIEAGKLADLIVLDKDPIKDIRNTNSVVFTIVNGRIYDAFTMNELAPDSQPRGPFYWETGRENLNDIEWKPIWGQH